jgi:hypothetical protein
LYVKIYVVQSSEKKSYTPFIGHYLPRPPYSQILAPPLPIILVYNVVVSAVHLGIPYFRAVAELDRKCRGKKAKKSF